MEVNKEAHKWHFSKMAVVVWVVVATCNDKIFSRWYEPCCYISSSFRQKKHLTKKLRCSVRSKPKIPWTVADAIIFAKENNISTESCSWKRKILKFMYTFLLHIGINKREKKVANGHGWNSLPSSIRHFGPMLVLCIASKLTTLFHCLKVHHLKPWRLKNHLSEVQTNRDHSWIKMKMCRNEGHPLRKHGWAEMTEDTTEYVKIQVT